jgi:hypothetical protein
MNATEINEILRRHCGELFIGVFAKDRLPTKLPRRPALMVVNTDRANQPGTHWLAMFFDDDGSGEYFDSFGEPAEETFALYMNKHCTRWIFSERQLQSVVSRFCGHHVVFYALYRSIGYNLNAITSWFSSDMTLNDVMTHEFVCRRIR